MPQFEFQSTPKDVAEIEHWLRNEAFGIKLIYEQQDNIHKIEATKVFDSRAFEITIEYNRARKSIHLNVECLEEINAKHYFACLDLLNFFNHRFDISKFSLDPETETLSRSFLTRFTKDEIDSLEFMENLYRDI